MRAEVFCGNWVLETDLPTINPDIFQVVITYEGTYGEYSMDVYCRCIAVFVHS